MTVRMTYNLKIACVLLTVLVRVNSLNGKYEVQHRLSSEGCVLPKTAINCVTEDGEVIDELNTDTVASRATCLCRAENENATVERICVQHGPRFVWKDTTEEAVERFRRSRKQRRILQKRSWKSFVHTFTSPINSIINTGINIGTHLICSLVCSHQSGSPIVMQQPPHYPPSLKCATIDGPNTIVAREGELSAPVKWTEPVATEQGGGSISVKTNPSSFKSGNQFSEGTYVVSFWAATTYGLSAECAISFTVKVIRCNPPRWPNNGKLKCTGNRYILGDECSTSCNNGYQPDPSSSVSMTCLRSGWSTQTSDCFPTACKTKPVVLNGAIYCPRNKAVFGATCTVACNDGYKRDGSPFMYCDESGDWNRPPTCADKTAPVFDHGRCPNDIQVNIDSSNNTAMVKWDIPTGKDNSGKQPDITERHHYKPGQMLAGMHTIAYDIVDSNNNRGFPCTFIVQVQTISCQPPSLNVEGAKYMLYHCPQLYRWGATCTLSCRSGYPLGGANEIQCLNDSSNPPNLSWHWDHEPFCKETCQNLPAPANGAMACSLWDRGNTCQLQCQEGYDIPLVKNNAQYVCGTSNGKWIPNDDVSDCNKKRNAHQMNVKSDVYYFTGKCNSSTDNLKKIQENFVKVLNTSQFRAACVGVPDCKAEFVKVTCGPTTTRRKRSVSTRLAYTVTFDMFIPFHPVPGRSIASLFTESQNMLYDMSDAIQKEVDSGHFNIPGRDMHIKTDSFGYGTPDFVCPEGTIPKQDTASCSGCPTGRFFSKSTGDCQYCQVGTYQDTAYSLDCKSCPPRSNTTHEGATEQGMCKEYCKAGYHSPTGLSPCVACDSTSFQSKTMSSSCKKCEPGKKTKSEGSTSRKACQSYDVRLDQGSQFRVKAKSNMSSLTLSTWVFLVQKNEECVLFSANSTDKLHYFTVSRKQNLVVEADWGTFDTGNELQPFKWYHIGVSLDGTKNTIEVYINGTEVYSNNALLNTRALIVQIGDRLEVKGGMQLSSYNLLSHASSEADVAKWSSSCDSATSGSVLTSDVIALSQNVIVITPSMCDAVDECDSNPCGRHTCINKQGSYECRCLDGYTGDQCTIKPDFCIDNACQHGATCIDGASNYTCSCTYGYSGDHCEIKAVDGGWSDWTDWAQCSKTCGGGKTSRTRQCNSPSPDPEGAPCQGSSSESRDCNEDECPECTRLLRSYGVVQDCNTTDTLTRCAISCRPGLYFTTPPLPYYECGAVTGYKWNHQTDDNPRARLPVCSAVKPPVEMGVSLDGHYETLECSKANNVAVIKSLEAKLTSLECVKEGSCETDIVPKSCSSNTRKRRSGNALSVSVNLKSSVKSDGSDFSFASVVENKTAPSESLVGFLKQAMTLEESAQQVFNNSVDFFRVTVNGKTQTVGNGTSGVSVTPVVRCPSGSVRLDVFCAECPVGSYADGYTVHLCPRGQYQDQTGQSTCKPCPQGKTTQGTGSVDISECTGNNVHSGEKGHVDDSSDATEGVKIAIGVCVSIGILILAGAAIVFVYKYINNRRHRVNDSTHGLQGPYPMTYVAPSNTHFQKQPL